MFDNLKNYLLVYDTRYSPRNDSYWLIKSTNIHKNVTGVSYLCFSNENHYSTQYKNAIDKKAKKITLTFDQAIYMIYEEYKTLTLTTDYYENPGYIKRIVELVNCLTDETITVLELDRKGNRTFHFKELEDRDIYRSDLDKITHKDRTLFLFDRWKETLWNITEDMKKLSNFDEVMRMKAMEIINLQRLSLPDDEYQRWFETNARGRSYNEVVRNYIEYEARIENEVHEQVVRLQETVAAIRPLFS